MYLVINKCVTAAKISNFSGHYLRNRSTLDVGVMRYIGIVQHKEHSSEVLSIPPGISCICMYVLCTYVCTYVCMHACTGMYVYMYVCMYECVYV